MNYNCRDKITKFTTISYLAAFMLNAYLNSWLFVLLFYITSIACAVLAFIKYKVLSNFDILAFFCLFIVTSIINKIVSQNITINKVVYTLMGVYISIALLDPQMNDTFYLRFFYLNFVIVFSQLLFGGYLAPIYSRETNNYVSVYLLYSSMLFYLKCGKLSRKIQIFPAFLYCICCILAQGRMGIICGFLFFFGILVYYFLTNNNRVNKSIMFCCFVVVLLFAIFLGGKDLFIYVRNMDVFSRFLEKKMDGGGRTQCWLEYLNVSRKDIKFLLFGARIDLVSWANRFNGNLHNSFLFIHAYNGLFMLLLIILLLFKDVTWAVKYKKAIYGICLVTMCIRGLTDYFFWGTSGTPFFLLLLLYPIYYNKLFNVNKQDKEC